MLRADVVVPAAPFSRLPAEIALRVLGRAVTRRGDEGPVELGKLEAMLAAALPAAKQAGSGRFRRSLAGALVTIAKGAVFIEMAPPRGGTPRLQKGALTTRIRRTKSGPKSR